MLLSLLTFPLCVPGIPLHLADVPLHLRQLTDPSFPSDLDAHAAKQIPARLVGEILVDVVTRALADRTE